MTITGSGFTGATSVYFNSSTTPATSFAVMNDGTITAVVPNTCVRGLVYVVAGGMTGMSATNFNPIPTVSTMTPGGGPIATSVIIGGANLLQTTDVSFNGVPSPFAVQSATSLAVSVPAGATVGPVTVTTTAGVGTSAIDFLAGPQITSFTPTSGPPGTVVTITGLNFAAATNARFNGFSASTFVVDSDTQITATVPATATTGVVSVVAPSPRGSGASSTNFTVTAAAPTVSSFTPASGAANTVVRVNGTSFAVGAAGQFSISGGGFVGGSTTRISSIALDVVVPVGAVTGPIRVCVGANCGAASATNFTVGPLVQGFNPTSGNSGTVVTLTGRNFTGATAVTFGGVAASAFNVTLDTMMTATVPPGAPTGPIVVTASGVSGSSPGNFIVGASITSFTPTMGGIGVMVDLVGTNFDSTSAVRFNGTSTTYNQMSATLIRAQVPGGATTGRITVVTPAGTATSATDFIVFGQPTITSVTPNMGGVGQTVTIMGTNLAGATSVTFNGTAASITNNTNTSITVTVPAGASTGVILVTTPGGTANSPAPFQVGPSITGFTPSSGLVGANIMVMGANFVTGAAVTFNNVNAPQLAVSSGNLINVTVPPGATSGRIRVTTPGGTAVSATDFIVALPPTLTSFTPTSGPLGTTVAINGTNFGGATLVLFNGNPAQGYLVNGAGTQIMATVATGTTSGTINVTTPGGSVTSSGSFTVTSGMAIDGGLTDAAIMIDAAPPIDAAPGIDDAGNVIDAAPVSVDAAVAQPDGSVGPGADAGTEADAGEGGGGGGCSCQVGSQSAGTATAAGLLLMLAGAAWLLRRRARGRVVARAKPRR